MLPKRSYSITELEHASGTTRRTIVYYIQQGLLPKVGRRGPHTRYPEECLHRLVLIRQIKALQDQGELLTVNLGEIRRIFERAGPGSLGQMASAGMTARLAADLLSTAQLGAATAAGDPPQADVPDTAPLAETPPDTVTPMTVEASGSAAPGSATAPAAPEIQWPEIHRPPPGPSTDGRSYGLADASIRYRAQPAAPRDTVTETRETVATQAVAQPVERHVDNTQPRLQALQLERLPLPAPAIGDGADLGELLRNLELRATLGKRRLAPGASEQWTEIPVTSRIYLSVRGLGEDDVPLADAIARVLKRALRG